MGILADKSVLVTGVLTDASIAFHVAKIAQEQGAHVVLSSFGRQMKITQVIAKRLPSPAPVVELDVGDEDDLAQLATRVGQHTDQLHGVVHSIGFAPPGAFDFLGAAWEDVATAVQISAFSLKSLAMAAKPLLHPGSGIVGLTFDANVAWPAYDWMGRPDRCVPPQPSPFRTSSSSSGGTSGPRPAGTSTTRHRPPRRASRCCLTGSRRRRVRSCMSTVVFTRWVVERWPTRRPDSRVRTAPWW